MSLEKKYPIERKEQHQPDLQDLRKFVFDSFKFSQGDQSLHRQLVGAFADLYPETVQGFQDLLQSEQGADFWETMIQYIDKYTHNTAHRDNIVVLSTYDDVHKVASRQVMNVQRWLEFASTRSDASTNNDIDKTLRGVAGDIIYRDHRYMINNAERMKMRKPDRDWSPLRVRSDSYFVNDIILSGNDIAMPTIASVAAQAGSRFVRYAHNFNEEELYTLNLEERMDVERSFDEAGAVVDMHIANHPEDADRLAELSNDVHRAYNLIDGILSGRSR